MRWLLLPLLLAVAGGCSAPAADDPASDDSDLTTTDSGDKVVFALDSVKSFELTLDPADMKRLGDQAAQVTNGGGSVLDDRLKAKGTFRYAGAPVPVTADCDVTKTYGVTVKIKGLASLQGFDRKPSLRIDFDDAFCGLKNLTLNNMVQDDTLVNEALAYEMYAAMGVPVPRLGYSQLSVNGESYGVYLTLETIDKNFLRRNFDDDGKGALYEGTYGGDLRTSAIGTPNFAFTGSDSSSEATDHAAMKALIAAVDAPNDDVFYGAKPLVETDTFVAMMATAYVIGDWDNYLTANNYRLYQSTKTNRWSFVPTGTDQTFRERLHPFRGFLGRDQAFSRLFDKCVASTRCLTAYAKALDVVLQKMREADGTLTGTMTRRAVLIQDAVKADTRRPQTDASLDAARNAMAAFINARAGDIAAAKTCMTNDAEKFPGACAGLVVVSTADGHCIDNYGNTANDGASVRTVVCHGKANQRVLAKPLGNGDYELRFANSDKCFDVKDRQTNDGATLQQWSCVAGAPSQTFTRKGQQWVAKHSGKCLALGGGDANVRDLVQTTCSADASQAWDMKASPF